MGSIIGDTQSAFLHGRFILDGVVALNEAIEDARKTKSKRLFIKIDFAKAFDTISWDYLLDIKRKFNFPSTWIAWIRECLASAKANVLVNGSPSGEFDLNRGVRQGDPLSPFLFLLAAEGLNLLTRRAVERNLLQPAIVGKNNIVLSHLQYADDTIFVVSGNRDNAKALWWLLLNFEMISGLSVNYNKSWAFGINLSNNDLHASADAFGCRIGTFPIPYLGLKIGSDHRCFISWNDILKKVERRINKWDVQTLSMAGRTTLIRSVLTSIPTYALSFMPLPKNVYHKLTRLFRDFLWGSQGNTKKIAWIKWDDLLRPKEEGGLGLLNLLSFNKALLCKWIWRFISTEDSLWKRIIISRHGDLPWSSSGTIPSRIRQPLAGWWRKITSLVDGEKGVWFWNLLRRQLGDGKGTNFWEGAWAGTPSLKLRYPRLFHLSANQNALVSDIGVWEDGTWIWKLNWRRQLRSSELAMQSPFLESLGNVPKSTSAPDKWDWSSKPAAVSIVQHLYSTLEDKRRHRAAPITPHRAFNLIWRSSAPVKAQLHGWRLCRDRLPTMDNLRKRIDWNGMDTSCGYCKDKEESSLHLFFDCSKVRLVWDSFLCWIGYSWAAPNSPRNHLLCFASLPDDKKKARIFCGLWICIVWVWWKWRNAIVFDKKDWSIQRIIDEIKCRFWNWCVVRGQADPWITFDSWSRSPTFLL